MEKNAKIYIAGHTGLLGSAILRRLKKDGYENIITRLHKELDLTQQLEVEKFFKKEMPDYVILSAAKVGGIQANITYPARFIYENLAIQINVIHSAYLYKVKKLLFFGSACSYPLDCPQPMKEDCLFSGYLEPTNEAYALAKITGMKMCQLYNREYKVKFICAVPTNIYGPQDNFNLDDAHVIPALIRKFHEAKVNRSPTVTVWGTGRPYREFIYVDDIACACLFLMNHYDDSQILNIGSGEEVSIKEIAYLIKDIVGFNGDVIFDTLKPDGVSRKVLDITKINNLGWKAKTSLREGIKQTYKWYINHLDKI